MTTVGTSDSLLGQLQRGRGAGYLQALREDVAVVRPLLLECVTHDPRWDRQLEPRGDYYAALIQQVGLPLDAFARHLRNEEGAEGPDANDLILGTVCALVMRGSVPASAFLRDYVTYGEHWEAAFETLGEAPGGYVGIDELSRLINERFLNDQALDEALPQTGPGMHTRQEPWRSLRLLSPRVDRLLREHEEQAERRLEQEARLRAALSSLKPPELLARAEVSNRRFVAMALEQRATASDLELLLDAARHGNQDQQYVAFRGLKRLAHPAALPVLCTYFQTFPQRPGFVFGAAVQAIAALPPDQTLSLARDWFRADNEVQRLVARRILAKHATFAELTHCREVLQAALQKGTPNLDYYLICDMLQALQRLPEEGPYPEAEVAFQEACYSRTRIYASEVLASSDRAHFSETTAVECLWDCEDQVREIGCDNVNGQIADVYQRLQILAGDPLEEEAVSAVARSRLAEGHGLEPTF